MKTHIVLIAVILLGCSVCAQASVLTYSAADDFSATNNPNGAWTYGNMLESAGPASFTPFANHETYAAIGLPGIDGWNTATGAWDPGVNHNGTSSTISKYYITWAPNALCVDRGTDVNGVAYDGSVRWTAPAAGTLAMAATFTGVQVGNGSTSSGYVFQDGTSLWSKDLGQGGTGTFLGSVQVVQGDVIDFVVGAGTQMTQLDARLTLTTIPEPCTLVLLATGLVGLLAYAWRRRK